MHSRTLEKRRGIVHFLVEDNYYACIRAVGNGVRGLATKNPDLVDCENCLKHYKLLELAKRRN